MTELRYARSGDVQIGYAVIEGGTKLEHTMLLAVAPNYPFELMLEQPDLRRFLDGLAAMGRLVLYDRRGIGCSDPIVDWERPLIEQWADDIDAVVQDAGLASVNVIGDLGPPAVAWAARRPPMLERLVLWNYLTPPGPDDAWIAELSERMFAHVDGEDDVSLLFSPVSMADPSFRAWSDRAGRTGASPALARRLMQLQVEPGYIAAGFECLRDVEVPTLVLARMSTPLMELVPADYPERPMTPLPDAVYVDLSPGDQSFASDPEPVVAEISAFITGRRASLPQQRALMAVLFTDLVDSTSTAQAVGDAAWRRLLDLHDEATRAAVERHGGVVVKTTGDGVLATLPTASAAFRAARATRRSLRERDLGVRAGVHVGEVDLRGEDVSGLSVNLAARVMGLAAPGQILVSAAAAQAALGQGFELQTAGAHDLKGIDGSWELHELV